MPECRQCGQCCTYIMFPLVGITKDNDPLEIAKYVEAHNFKIFAGEKHLMARALIGCRFLEYDTPSGKAVCLLINSPKRPKFCQKYYCESAERGEEDAQG